MAQAQTHKLTDVDVERQVATCSGCGPDSPISYRRDRGYWLCQVGRNFRRTKRLTDDLRAYSIPTKFGISIAEYDELLATQDGVCAICFLACSTGRHLCVDHDHDTGRIRGLLCSRCNRAIGLLYDDPARLRSAVAYLQ